MRFSQLFTKIFKEAPRDEESINAKLLIQGGFMSKVISGAYVMLPLGWRVLEKINNIIRGEMNGLGAEELLMTVFQDKEVWQTSGRWESAKEVMYQFKDLTGREIGLGWTHEEPLTYLAKNFISSYRDLPRAVYQIQTKFRNEARARSGLLRGREFLMKDLYSFHADEKDLDDFYEKAAAAYERIFERVGVKARRTLASGGLFCKYSDEFQVLAEAGEDDIVYCTSCDYTANAGIAASLNLADECPRCGGRLAPGKSIEVGNIFKLGTKFSEAFNLLFSDINGNRLPVIMASYGIGPGRLLATVVETSHDEKGIIWPEAIAPFRTHLILLEGGEEKADQVYDDLKNKGAEILYDDISDKTAGEKFADADLIGCPIRLVVSKKSLAGGGIEVKRRAESETKIIQLTQLSSFLL